MKKLKHKEPQEKEKLNTVNLIGYQIESNDGQHEIPDCFHSFEVITTIEIADLWIRLEKMTPENGQFRWVIVPVFEGDIEEPTFIDYI